MDFQSLPCLAIVILIAVLSRLPFLRFPMDEDMATFTYRARFAARGFEWKRDLFVFYPTCRMRLFDALYGRPGGGVLRIRLFFMAAHIVTSLAVYSAIFFLTGNPFAALFGGASYAFFATAPALCAVSFNFEPLYLPLLLIGLQLLWRDMIPLAGICFGLAVVLKVSTGIYVPVMMLFVARQYGYGDSLLFMVAAAAPGLISHALDWSMGYLDQEAKKQFNLRLAATLRCAKLKRMYGSISQDIRLTVKQTLPLWLAGIPGLVIASTEAPGLSISLFAVPTIVMILCQRGFSRYHYIPFIGLLALGAGPAVDRLWRMPEPVAFAAAALLVAATVWTLYRLAPFYLRPLEAETLARYDKFDQFIYLPYLGKILKRLVRIRKETDRRLFVWGNFIQLYHETGLPAADRFAHYCIGPWDSPVLEEYFDTVIGGLMRHQPVYLVKAFPDLDMELLERVTGLRYRLIKVALARFPIYRLAGFTPPAGDPLDLPWREKMRLFDALTQGEHVPGIDKTAAAGLSKTLNECRKLCRLNPHDTQGMWFLAELQDRLGQADAAASTCEKLLHENPSDPRLLLLLAKQKVKQNRPDETRRAREIYNDIWKRPMRPHEDGLRTQAAVAVAELDSGRRPEAETLERFLARDPRNESLAYARASALERRGNREQARRLFEQFTATFTKPPLQAAAWFRLARLSPPEQREQILKQCLKLDPAHSGAQKLLQALETCRVEA
ncbi:MAG: tetratricopeptide repeat protein [Nitrospinales bacterium]